MQPPTQDPSLSYPSPSQLVFSELGPREVLLGWTPPGPPAPPVLQYRLVYHTAEGQSPQEVQTSSALIGRAACLSTPQPVLSCWSECNAICFKHNFPVL